MRKYIVKRLLLSVMILFCVSFIIYTLMRCLPGSFVETRRCSFRRELVQSPMMNGWNS